MSAIAAVGGITIDAVQRADGTYADGLLGGNAVYGAWAASLWLASASACLVGCVGDDFPTHWLRILDDAGIDTSPVAVIPGRSTPVWRMEYQDGDHRHELAAPTTLVTTPTIDGALEPRLTGDEPVLARVGAVHCGPVQPDVLLHNLAVLGGLDVTVLVDPGEESAAWDDAARAEVLAHADIYCPSLDDLPDVDGRALADVAAELASRGPGTVVLKLGTAGSIVRAGGRTVHIPAAPVVAVDPTGAGDSYCGAFLAALVRFDDAFVAGVIATATASLAVEGGGLLRCLQASPADARRRAQAVAGAAGVTLPPLD